MFNLVVNELLDFGLEPTNLNLFNLKEPSKLTYYQLILALTTKC